MKRGWKVQILWLPNYSLVVVKWLQNSWTLITMIFSFMKYSFYWLHFPIIRVLHEIIRGNYFEKEIFEKVLIYGFLF